ncbi:NAD(P)H-hydrate dehydratase [Rhizobium oryzicola]|uniref:Bifunctional NAD(P)H-hydrate repair enzyme n=1 Tax=Rhizobium oryzicola TaxID=1232668 RepID=A0ABT8SZ66_9HYPH|nr:NAD(P)H-hydrate dehydratase [Rhizobium oryzicola]MDO1583651.1 NAD(P)H-hydrate dehydratase [Rhizobium oryzicola]
MTSRNHRLFTPEEMGLADRLSAESGIDSFALMERAGQAVAASALKHWPDALRFVVLCGPGNNGGDGYVAARALASAGAAVSVYHLGDPQGLQADAREAKQIWHGDLAPLAAYVPTKGDVIIDALFGAGLSRPVPDPVAELISAVNDLELSILAVDLPSGVSGRHGVVLGAAFRAARTVTFMSRKPGHLLLPGRELCGELEVFDIGIPQRILDRAGGKLFENHPDLWRHTLPALSSNTHKYRRGHLAVFSGGASHTGAARLSAAAGLVSGAGLVTVAAPSDAISVLAPALTAVMLREIDNTSSLQSWLDTAKLSAFVLGPGFGVGSKTRDFVRLLADRSVVVDADGITSFKDDPAELFTLFANGPTRLVLTPHEGEFARLFPDLAESEGLGKVEKAQAAAKRANAAIVYKGADTVIAAPDGRAFINTNAPPWLATAGSGDVFAGIIGALLAQGVPAFEAAAAGVWLHGEAANASGPGMTAETLIPHIPSAFDLLHS